MTEVVQTNIHRLFDEYWGQHFMNIFTILYVDPRMPSDGAKRA